MDFTSEYHEGKAFICVDITATNDGDFVSEDVANVLRINITNTLTSLGFDIDVLEIY